MTTRSEPHTVQIAVIVVNYGTADLAIQAVESVLSRHHEGRNVHVHLVDNASPNQDHERLNAAYADGNWVGRVTLWLEDENHGFGRGNNVVLQALARQDTVPDAVFLLNPDACLHNEAVTILARALDQDPTVAAVGAGVLRPDLSPTTAAFRFPSGLSEVARILALGVVDRLCEHRKVALPPDQPAGFVDWVSGAAVMFRFDAIARVNFFDPGFFLYYEEVDLMRRLRDSGLNILYVPQAQVVHVEGAATGQFSSQVARQRDPWYLYQSWAYYFSRAFGRGRALVIACLLWPAAVMNVLHRKLRGKPPTIPKRFFMDHWTYVIWPLLRGS